MLNMVVQCPVCGSSDIHPLVAGCMGQVFRCRSCGYRGSFVVEIESVDGHGGYGR